MVRILKLLAEIINYCHDKFIDILKAAGLGLTDKQLHFLIIGIIGICLFVGTQLLFKWLAKHSITAISFIYTFTVMIVIVFAIEIEQKLTGAGNMEFGDILYGLYGFLFLFGIYLIIKLSIIAIKRAIQRSKEKKKKHKK